MLNYFAGWPCDLSMVSRISLELAWILIPVLLAGGAYKLGKKQSSHRAKSAIIITGVISSVTFFVLYYIFTDLAWGCSPLGWIIVY